MRVAYADPPYPRSAKRHYEGHPDYAGEVDHAALLERLAGFDGWILHTHSPALSELLPLCPADVRVCAWVKPFAAFKEHVSLAYAWEPVIIRAARPPTVRQLVVMRDWISCPITLQKGLSGAKPEAVCVWAFEAAGCEHDDELLDLYPGTGAVGRAWEAWKAAPRLQGLRDKTGERRRRKAAGDLLG
jgi:hypothetical protein